MLSKFETKSNRVKGICFHPKRPWILASLHNGSVQLWDYKMGTLIDKFDEHEGPVRGIHFHPTQPLFVSGGDDYKIKVWNWKQRRCLFTLNGHLDYIRTVFFHHEYPWIISASDDQTIRIWNWQSRTCISILTGHSHYVMCAQFHHKEDLVVSASLDQTVRVWDISGLRKKHFSPNTMMVHEELHRQHQQQGDIFGNTDCIVKYILEGHDRGVNWAAFHPNLPLIVSGADDRQIKLWRMNETKAWEVDTCRGHYNNVSCAIFHPRQELILSNSEDKTIRIWDMSKRTAIHTFRREHDRFWIIAAHPELNLFAAGHDSGLIVFKLERERPAYTGYQSSLYYVKDRFVRYYDFNTGNDVALLSIRKSPSAANGAAPPRSISYNPAEHAVLVTSTADGGTYELYNLPRDSIGEPRESNDFKRGSGQSAVFIARNRFAVLDKAQGQILIKDLRNETTKTIKSPAGVTELFYAGTKNLLLATPSSVMLYDTELRSVVGELNVGNVRYVIWSQDMSMVALLSKHTIVIANKQLEQLSLIHETIKIKSGAWDDIGIFVYTTLNHIKYALPQGDNGIIRTLEQPVYLCKVKGKNVFCLDRDGKIRIVTIDPTEYRFKLALVKQNFEEVLHIIRNSNLVGQAIIAYLQKKGYPEVALHFVKEPKTRFELALECGNLEVALETAKIMDKEDAWNKLGAEALKQGNHAIVEMAYQRVKNFERLSFLYLVNGDSDKLKKMMKIAEMRGDSMSRYHNALYLGDVEEQLRVYKELGQLPLAYLLAKTHGYEEEAASILAAAGIPLESAPGTFPGAQLLKPPTPILRKPSENWPVLSPDRGFFENALIGMSNGGAQPKRTLDEEAMRDVGGDWNAGEPDLDLDAGRSRHGTNAVVAAATQDLDLDLGGDGGWDIEDDLGLADAVADGFDNTVAGANGTNGTGPVAGMDGVMDPNNPSAFVAPVPGTSINDHWCRNSMAAVDHVAAGNFESAMQILHRQVGIVNFAPLKPFFMAIQSSTRAYLACNSLAPPLSFPIQRDSSVTDTRKYLPFVAVTLQSCLAKLQEAYAVTTAGRFVDALAIFRSILHQLLFVVVDSKPQSDEIQQLIVIAREYILGLRMEIARKEITNADTEAGMKRIAELAAYFTHCQLQPAHLQLSVRSAMTICFKLKNHVAASLFARRLLEMGPPPQVTQQVRKLITICEQTPSDAVKLDYDPYNSFVMCGGSFVPIYRGSSSVECPFCKTAYLPQFRGGVCQACEVAEIGGAASGLRSMV